MHALKLPWSRSKRNCHVVNKRRMVVAPFTKFKIKYEKENLPWQIRIKNYRVLYDEFTPCEKTKKVGIKYERETCHGRIVSKIVVFFKSNFT